MKILAFVYCLFSLSLVQCREKRQIEFPGDQQCRTPNRLSGICISLTDCPQLRRIRDFAFLRRSTCGYERNIPRVCCPNSNRIVPSEPIRPIEPDRPIEPVRPIRPIQTPRPSILQPPTDRPRSQITKPAILPADCGRSDKTGSRIFGGRKSELNAWPWLAAVYLTRSGLSRGTDCGGALITNRHVITAAHCVMDSRGNRLNPSSLTVRLGEHKLNDDNDGARPVDYLVREIRSHPGFVSRTYKNDIAILVLDRTVSFNDFIRPICLPYGELSNQNLVDRSAFVAGWGTTAFNGNFNPELTEIQIPIWTNENCRRVFQREVPITREYICAGVSDGTKDSCQGDSGGPLMLPSEEPNSDISRYYAVGIVSFGKRCATPGYPGVYTRITVYLDWIAANLS